MKLISINRQEVVELSFFFIFIPILMLLTSFVFFFLGRRLIAL